uniref:Uncharacterized protein n=1 Tax=Anguilla anguilla TaxID=7936 RepID=A0A0E9X530_ANGAN
MGCRGHKSDSVFQPVGCRGLKSCRICQSDWIVLMNCLHLLNQPFCTVLRRM